jgi:hypothetical protein
MYYIQYFENEHDLEPISLDMSADDKTEVLKRAMNFCHVARYERFSIYSKRKLSDPTEIVGSWSKRWVKEKL